MTTNTILVYAIIPSLVFIIFWWIYQVGHSDGYKSGYEKASDDLRFEFENEKLKQTV